MVKSKNKNFKLGKWAFLIGVVLALIIGLVGLNSKIFPIDIFISILIIIGLIIGLLNITEKEVEPFMKSGVILIISSALGYDIMQIIPMIKNILIAMLAIFVPATIIVTIKNVFIMANR